MIESAAMLRLDAERWKRRAAQARQLAESMGQDPARDVLLEIAEIYEQAAPRHPAAAISLQTHRRAATRARAIDRALGTFLE